MRMNVSVRWIFYVFIFLPINGISAKEYTDSDYINKSDSIMMYADLSSGRPFSKDPAVVRFNDRYYLYYSMRAENGWAIGIAQSEDMLVWKKIGELLPQEEYESKGMCAPGALVKDGKIHLFYQRYGYGAQDAICHAYSEDGLHFTRNPTNPIFHPTGDWNNGRAIDADVIEHKGKLLLYFATRDPSGKVQKIGVASAPYDSDYSRSFWTQECTEPILEPELPWEKNCIEASALCKHEGKLYMFYAGAYNNEPQQIGCAVSEDGIQWKRLFDEPFLPCGKEGEWNSSESGHPYAFQEDGKTYLFYQGNSDNGKTWFLSKVEIAWNKGLPILANLKLWYPQPATEWVEALPIGNGRLGAMIFGGIERERIQFNKDTLWTGIPRDYINPNAKETVPKVRKLLFEGKQSEAEKVAWDIMSIPLRQEAYQPFGDLHLHFPGHENAKEYRRELNLDEAVAKVQYRVGDVLFQREIFSSAPDQVIVIHITASQPGQIHCKAALDSPHENTSFHVRNNRLYLDGQLEEYYDQRSKKTKPSILKFQAVLQIRNENGEIVLGKDTLEIQAADEVTLILSAETSYQNYKDVSGDPAEKNQTIIGKANPKTYKQLKESHTSDYQELFHRMSFDLGSKNAVDLPTDQRIKQFGEQDDPQLIPLYFQYGRYLLLSSSRPGSQPANLQGIWNEQLRPPWESKWTVNINTEMNYWPAELCNLSECHFPLFDMIDDLTETGGKVAQEHYGCRGWVLHHNTDIWRGAAPINHTNHGIWPTGGAWLCQHLWMHYQFTGDKKFLKERGYPAMKGAALFFVDFLAEDPKTGWLISTPSNSPENGGLVAGPTMDHQIIRSLFGYCIEASEILGVDEELRETWKLMRKRIAPNQIGRFGQLQEWLQDIDDPNNTHRHVSHLWGLHPGWEITPRDTPDIADAAKVSLEHRGDGGTGWSKAWKVNFWARLLDGDHAYKMLSDLITKSTLPNMFDTHPPFQIDGNFGGTSGIIEMLLQSHTGEIELLPALPAAWPDGTIKGLCARGGFIIDLHWSDGKITEIKIVSKTGETCRLRYRNMRKEFETDVNRTYFLDNELHLR